MDGERGMDRMVIWMGVVVAEMDVIGGYGIVLKRDGQVQQRGVVLEMGGTIPFTNYDGFLKIVAKNNFFQTELSQV